MNDSYCLNKRSKQAGLTLIELMIVIAIVSILGVISTPMYQGYKLKTKIGSAIPMIAPVQRLVLEYYVFNNAWPADNAEAGAKEPDTYNVNYLTRIDVTDSPEPGAIRLTYDTSRLRVLGTNNTLIYYPADDGTTWKCDAGTLADRYRPANCRS